MSFAVGDGDFAHARSQAISAALDRWSSLSRSSAMESTSGVDSADEEAGDAGDVADVAARGYALLKARDVGFGDAFVDFLCE